VPEPQHFFDKLINSDLLFKDRSEWLILLILGFFVTGLLGKKFFNNKKDFDKIHNENDTSLANQENIINTTNNTDANIAKILEMLDESEKHYKENTKAIVEKKGYEQDFSEELDEVIQESKDVGELYSQWEHFSNKITPKLVSVLLAEVEALHEAGEYYKALESAEKAYRINPKDFNVVNWCGIAFKFSGNYDQAERKLKDAIDLADNDKNLAIAKGNLAGVLKDMGRYEESETLYREVLVIHREAYSDDHPYIAVGLGNLAGVLQDMGRYEEAEKLYRESLDINRKAYEPNHPYIATDINNLANLYFLLERYDDAKEYMEEAIAIRRIALGEEHPYTIDSLKSLEIINAKIAEQEGER